MPFTAHRRMRVVFPRRTQPTSTRTEHATSPLSNQRNTSFAEEPSDEAAIQYSVPVLPVNSARTGPHQPYIGSGVSPITLPPPSAPDPAPPVNPRDAAYLFPTPPPTSHHSTFLMSSSSVPPSAASAETSHHASSHVPYQFLSAPELESWASESKKTDTSELQRDTVEGALPFLSGQAPELGPRNEAGLPRLFRDYHVDFLKESLEEMPAPYVGYDPSRPWVVYWGLNALSLLGEDIGKYEERAIETFTAAQNPNGGFGGSHGHQSHIAGTYAVVLSSALLGEKALNLIDRRNMWRWLGSLKQADGGFAVSEGAEVDIRGAFCSMVIIALLNLPSELPPDAPARQSGLSSFTDRLPVWLSRCQTYEGGISGRPGTEAHGAYAFCAIGCACLIGEPKDAIPKIFDLLLLISWLSARQYAPEGGFSGRTNKLVDGCYSHWVGGCWPLIDASLTTSGKASEGLYSREGLIRYIMSCCQSENGGLRDKPSMSPDGYHSCYVLSGLSSAQHRVVFDAEKNTSEPCEYGFRWNLEADNPVWEGTDALVGSEGVVKPIHPLFVIPFDAVERTRAWNLQKTGF